jgi:methionyl-tRNA formyltransferase
MELEKRDMKNIIIATIKEWNIKNYFKLKETLGFKYNFYLISQKEDLTFQNVSAINPKYIFFPHWSYKIDREIYENFECIIFHETDLPFGRGGSPIQNLIINGHYKTKISAIECSEILDSGDIYLQEDYDLSHGSAQEIFEGISEIVFHKMIPHILENKVQKHKQKGKVISFKRRSESQSNINELEELSLTKLYDFIRMLDAKSYPKAFLDLKNYRVHLSDITLQNNKLIGRFEINEKK